MHIFDILTIIFFCRLGASSVLNESLIRTFFQKKLCTVGTILNCNSKQENLRVIKNLMAEGYRISTFNITNPTISAELVVKKGDYNLAIIIDADCLNIEPFMQSCAQLKYFYESFRWLILTSDPDVYDKYQSIPLNINSDVTIATPLVNRDNVSSNWTIYDIYNPAFKHGGEAIIEELGTFDGENENVLRYTDEPRYYKRRNMTGVRFNSAMVIPEEISISLDEYLRNDKDRFNNTSSRFHSVTIENCKDLFEFDNNRTIVHSWGYEQPDGDVDGMLKQLKEHIIDFGNAPLMYRFYRVKFVDYSYGNWIIRSAFIFQHPKTTSSSYELYLRPLVDSVWLTTLGIIGLMIITLKIIMDKQAKILNEEETGDSNDGSWSFLILYGIGELCQQGFALIPAFVSGKIVTLTALLFSFMIYQFYSASIVSFLLSSPPRTIKTLEDLLNSPLEAASEDMLFYRDYFRTTTNPVAIKLYKTKIEKEHNHSNFFTPQVGLSKVVRGGYAFHAQISTAYPIIERTFPEKIICDLAEVELYPKEYFYMITSKHSPFREMFNYCMLHQMGVGVIDRLRKYWNARKPVCLEPTNYLEISVGLKESYWGLMLLGCGYLISFGFLVMEFLWKKENKFFNRKFFKIRKKVGNIQLKGNNTASNSFRLKNN